MYCHGKKLFLTPISLVIYALLLYGSVITASHAETEINGGDAGTEINGGADGEGLENPLAVDSLTELLVAIVNIITIIAIPIIVFFIILAGFRYVTAGGNPQKIQDSTRALGYALIGAVLILGAQAIIGIVQATVDEFTATGPGGLLVLEPVLNLI